MISICLWLWLEQADWDEFQIWGVYEKYKNNDLGNSGENNGNWLGDRTGGHEPAVSRVNSFNGLLESKRYPSATKDVEMTIPNILKTASLETIVRLSRAAEYKDKDTGIHVLRMSHYAAAIARRLGFSKNHADKILNVSTLHDIGKIGIPDSILMKQKKLTDKEWEIMKQHTVIGKRILSGSDAEEIRLGEIIAYTHHEWWDGSGYPQGLKGIEIPIESRIVALADVFDALTSNRPYKGASPLKEAYEIIRDESVRHFEPQVVYAFFSIESEVLQIMHKFTEHNFV